ncbi:hypothetical protein P12x_002144 [Tundrisphaera lichenicola]|uniref:hypothetical protein n=1 Tax=Tundrisphaera lichenicola TaxID=2029860 RepID=UPI003EB866AA
MHLSACSYWNVWGYDELLLYRHLSYHSPVAHALWHSGIRSGDQVDRVIALYRPNHKNRLGPFHQIEYYPSGDLTPGHLSLEGTSLTAKDGRLIRAESFGCTFQRIYFDAFTSDERELYGRLLQDKINARPEAAGKR